MIAKFQAILFILILLLSSGCASAPAATEAASPAPDLSAYPWIYLRGGEPLAPGEEPLSIIAVGDILLGRGVAQAADPFHDTASWLEDAALTIGNLEGVLVAGGTPRQAPAAEPQPIILNAPPAYAARLPQAGFDIIGLANNHSLDYGREGLRETIDYLQTAGLDVIGVAAGAASEAPYIREIAGLRLAFLAFNAVSAPAGLPACADPGACYPAPLQWDLQLSPSVIAAAREQADAVIISVHWGYEYQPRPDPIQESIAEAMLDAGADLVIGHHPHVPQTLAVQGDRVVAYSLGNFLFDQNQDDTQRGLALRAYFDDHGLRAVQALPVTAGRRPHLSSLAEAEPWLTQLLPPAKRQGYTCTPTGCVPAEVPAVDGTSRFYSGQIDLTGDGRPETIRRQGQQITIYEQGAAVWQSPEAWRVVDVALGDPNDDGRFEVMLAIWQQDADGYERSQPYIIGYRGGHYDLLWGGRPVADPILELEVGDVGGDGSDELIVIEELADGSAQALSVWRWAGWTFTHIWRSESGSYSDLQLIGEEKPLISVISDSP